MDTLRLMLLSLLIGATVSTSPTYTDEGFNLNQTITFGQAQAVQQVAAAPTTKIVYVTPSPAKASSSSSSSSSSRSTSISTGTSIKRELYRGCQGDDVRMLQKLLKDLNYKVSVDGYYGTQTRNAIIAFQRNNGLKADGIAGTRTIRRLASSSAIPAEGNSNRTTLSYGMRGQDVLELQYRLSTLGYYFDVCSGNYLTNTRAAVRWFQEVNGLPVDGIAGPMTLARVYSGSAIPAPSYPPSPTATTGVFYRSLYQGMSGADVSYLQQLLKDYGYFTGNPTAYFGSATYWAVSTFQAYNGLYSDGIAGGATQRKLLSGNVVPYPGGPTQTPGPITTPTVTPTAGPTATPAPTAEPGTECSYCKTIIIKGDEYKHKTTNVCGAHMLCQYTTTDHTLKSSCGHYKCVVDIDPDKHASMTSVCSGTDHYKCDGKTHTQRSCYLSGHFNCVDDGLTHSQYSCGQGHYQCDSAQTGKTHQLLACGRHLGCTDSNPTEASHSLKCKDCAMYKCYYDRNGKPTCTESSTGDHTFE